MTRNEQKLKDTLINLSFSNEWETAKGEWFLTRIDYDFNGGVCSCGKKPISEICHIKNRITNKEAIVGNDCIDKFLEVELPSWIFKFLEDIKKKGYTKFNKEYLTSEFNIFDESQTNFLLKNVRKRDTGFTGQKITFFKKLSDYFLKHYNDGLFLDRLKEQKTNRVTILKQTEFSFQSIDKNGALYLTLQPDNIYPTLKFAVTGLSVLGLEPSHLIIQWSASDETTHSFNIEEKTSFFNVNSVYNKVSFNIYSQAFHFNFTEKTNQLIRLKEY